jgi:amino acid adenylation domain-containing protein
MENERARTIAEGQPSIRFLTRPGDTDAPGTPLPIDGEMSGIDLVTAAARAQPDAIALRENNVPMTYRSLMAAVDRLAGELAAAGAGTDVPVGICLDRSFDYIISILATSAVGAAFLPLDPAWPEERLRFVLGDARAPVLVTSSARSGHLTGASRTILRADARPREQGPRTSRPCAPIKAGTLAYIIYTSGSSGVPKGVEITHGNLLSLLRWHWEAFSVTRRDRASCIAGLGFDAAVWEIWPYLTVGASVSLPDENVRTSSAALQRWLVDEKISMAFVPTLLAEPMITATWPAHTALRYLLTGGDTLHVRPIDGLPFAVVNNYGPTECTVVATSGIVAPSDRSATLPAIGTPIVGTRIHILDERGAPARAGDIGEIYIGGSGVGRGYRHRPALTAEYFVPDPFALNDDEARLYRTGDLARRLPDGQIAFHGRRDNQVKIRGHRVELDEVSSALNNHPLVAQSAVVGCVDGANMRLAAYVVATPNAEPSASDLREFLASRLPDYMLPSAFVSLPALPLTASGKLDRAALPEPTAANTFAIGEYHEPASTLEGRLGQIVAGVLDLDHVGAEDNFFLLGGHSLLGAQVVMKARDAFGTELTLRDLFQAQTVRKLAAKIEQRMVERIEQMTEAEAAQLLSATG